MHIISGLKKRCLGPTTATAGEVATGGAPSIPATKKQTAKEMREIREAENQATERRTLVNLTEAASAIEGGSESDNHGSEYGVPPEVAAEDEREALQVADWHAAQERDKEQQEDDARQAARDDSSVDEVEDALQLCPPPWKLKPEKKEA